MAEMTVPVEAAQEARSLASSSDLHLASALRIAIMRLSRRLRAERSNETLGLSQLSALTSLEHHGPLSPTALAEQERIQPPSMTRLIAGLEEAHLVERAPHPSDRRQSVIAITALGRQIVLEDRRRREAWLSRALEQFDDHEREQLRIALPLLERLGKA